MHPAAVTIGSMGCKEIDFDVSKGKGIIAVDTGTTQSVATYWAENDILVVACRKDIIENIIG